MKNLNNKSKREIKRLSKMVDAIEALDEKMQALSDDELRAKTQEFKDRLTAGETLDDLLVEAFAVVREAADRVLHCGELVDVEVSAVVCSDADFVFFLSEEHAVIDKSRQPAIIIDKICFFILDIPFLVFHYWNILRY